MWTESVGSFHPHTTQDITFKPQPKPVAAGLVWVCLWGSVSSQSACWQVVWRHDQYAADQQTTADALRERGSGDKPGSLSVVASAHCVTTVFKKTLLDLHCINLQARTSSFSQTNTSKQHGALIWGLNLKLNYSSNYSYIYSTFL